MDKLLPCLMCASGETNIHENRHSPTMSGGIKEPISVDITHWCAGDGLPRRTVKVTGRTRQEAIDCYNTRSPCGTPPVVSQNEGDDDVSDVSALHFRLVCGGEVKIETDTKRRLLNVLQSYSAPVVTPDAARGLLEAMFKIRDLAVAKTVDMNFCDRALTIDQINDTYNLIRALLTAAAKGR